MSAARRLRATSSTCFATFGAPELILEPALPVGQGAQVGRGGVFRHQGLVVIGQGEALGRSGHRALVAGAEVGLDEGLVDRAVYAVAERWFGGPLASGRAPR